MDKFMGENSDMHQPEIIIQESPLRHADIGAFMVLLAKMRDMLCGSEPE